MPIRILLLDDHALFRESLARLLASEPGLEIVGSCASVEAASAVLQQREVDVVLLDFDLGPERGSRFMHAARAAGYRGWILAVTAGLSDADALELLSEGVAGIFLKHNPPESLLAAIRRTVDGGVWLDQRSVQTLAKTARSRDEDSGAERLTTRERDVLRGVFEGLSNKEIGTRLEVSETSIKATLQHLFHKTGVRSRSQLVRIALDRYGRDWDTRSNT